MSKIAALCIETNKPLLVDKYIQSIEGEQYWTCYLGDGVYGVDGLANFPEETIATHPYHNKLVSIYDFTGVMNWYWFWRGSGYALNTP